MSEHHPANTRSLLQEPIRTETRSSALVGVLPSLSSKQWTVGESYGIALVPGAIPGSGKACAQPFLNAESTLHCLRQGCIWSTTPGGSEFMSGLPYSRSLLIISCSVILSALSVP